MRVLLIGSGGREHALAWKLARSPLLTALFATPGNPGIAEHATLLSSPSDPESLAQLAQDNSIDLVVVGPEQPLVDGLVDRLAARDIMAFGPPQAAAQLEGSKRFAKEFMERNGVPTASARAFTGRDEAIAYLEGLAHVPVVKQSGLAAGKGVTVAATVEEARQAVTRAFAGNGADGVVLEERLAGRELSLLGITDGSNWLPLRLAQDYKYFNTGDSGPMTGGMGAVAPVELLSQEQLRIVDEHIVGRTLSGLQAEGLTFAGVLFIGLMLTDSGVKVLEYNVRLGDPETQSVLPLLETDLLEVIVAACRGKLQEQRLDWRDQVAAGIVMAAPGYPGTPERGIPLTLPAGSADLLVFQAGTELKDGQLLSSGGRVLNVVGVADSLDVARARAYEAVSQAGFEGASYRTDIGLKPDVS